jgi:Icc-related predicted phosphoesterase
MKYKALPASNTFSKPRRPFGDPVSPLKPNPGFNPIPADHVMPGDLTYDLEKMLGPDKIASIQAAGKLIFHSVGDTGGVNGTGIQDELAVQMEEQITSAAPGDAPAFFYHLGDVVYYNGQIAGYKPQFYEPYQYYPAPIFAIPGNHDGDNVVTSTETSLEGFFENFCAATRAPAEESPYAYTVDQPWPYWTLKAPFVTIIGLYSNIEGALDDRSGNEQPQYDWFVGQLKEADPNKCLILAIHHPPYSLDTVHGGYQDILDAIDQASQDSGRTPNAVFTGHVHNYQRFTRTVNGKTYPYIIAGCGGYAQNLKNTHQLQVDPNTPDGRIPDNFQTTLPDVLLTKYNTGNPGFLRLTVDDTSLTGEYFINSFNSTPPPADPFDTFTLNWKIQQLA